MHINLPRYLPSLRNYPEGQVLSWRIRLEGKTLHQDNFFPPISTLVDTEPFVTQVRASHPDITVRILGINETFEI